MSPSLAASSKSTDTENQSQQHCRSEIRLQGDALHYFANVGWIDSETSGGLAIMSLAVANTVIAAGRSRTCKFGVMGAQGITRSQLVRVVFAETNLIGLSACLRSLKYCSEITS